MESDFDLDTLGAIEGTDKSSSVTNSWDYLRHYEKIFAPWRDEPINFIEIGIEEGPSLGVWLSYFSRANIIGLDIDPRCASLARDRVSIEIGSQADASFLEATCKKYPPTIVIDDGSHLADHIIFTFEHVFPKLAPGGVYIIEDMAFHFSPHTIYHVEGVSPLEYFNAISKARLARDSRTQGVNSSLDAYIWENVDSITYISGAIVIKKLDSSPKQISKLSAERYIENHGLGSSARIRFANHLARHGAAQEDVQAILDHIPSGDRDVTYFLTVANYLKAIGEWDSLKAQSALRDGLSKFPSDYHLAWRLGHIELTHGNDKQASAWLERAAENCKNQNLIAIYEMLSHAYEQQGRVKEAIDAVGRALANGPIDDMRANLESRRAALAANLKSSVA